MKRLDLLKSILALPLLTVASKTSRPKPVLLVEVRTNLDKWNPTDYHRFYVMSPGYKKKANRLYSGKIEHYIFHKTNMSVDEAEEFAADKYRQIMKHYSQVV